MAPSHDTRTPMGIRARPNQVQRKNLYQWLRPFYNNHQLADCIRIYRI